MKTIIKSVKIGYGPLSGGDCQDILIEDDRIVNIATKIEKDVDRIIDGAGLTALPGLVDMHAHLREPGLSHKETIATGTAAAAKGGYTTICCMPNTAPVIDSTEAMGILQDLIDKDALVKVRIIAAITHGLKGETRTDIEKLKEKGAIAFSDDGRVVDSAMCMREALKIAKENNVLLIEHCEENSLVQGGVINEGIKSRELGLKGIPNCAEEIIAIRDIILARELDTRIHIAHISTEGTLELVKWGKKMGAKVTCEVMPQHIALTEDIIEKGMTDAKVNPPIRTKKDAEALIAGLVDGSIDVIATDHAPHAKEDKTEDFSKSAFGISNIEHCFPICYTTLVKSGHMSISRLIEKMVIRPAEILSVEASRLQVGDIADLFLVDLEKEITIKKEEMLSKGKNTPFAGRKYFGKVSLCICEGRVAYEQV